MHLLFTENEEERETNFNKYENLFCPMERLDKKVYIEKWKSMTKEVKFTMGKLYSNKETQIIKRLQVNNMTGSAIKTIIPDKQMNLYMSCTTKNNILILFEMSLIRSNHIYAEVKYKSESNLIEKDFETYLTILLSDVESSENLEEVTCR